MASTKTSSTANSDVKNIIIQWNQDRFNEMRATYGIPNDVEPEFPRPNSTAARPPAGNIALYSKFFSGCGLCIPLTHFIIDVLRFYKIHLSQIHPMGMCRISFFEFCCVTLKRDPTVEAFNCFYKIYLRDSWFSFSKRGNITAHALEMPSSFKKWKEKLFYMSKRILPVDIALRSLDLPVPDCPADVETFKKTSLYQVLTRRPAVVQELPEHALVSLGLRRNWVFSDKIPLYVVGDELACCYNLLFPDEKVKLNRTCVETFHDCFFYPRPCPNEEANAAGAGICLCRLAFEPCHSSSESDLVSFYCRCQHWSVWPPISCNQSFSILWPITNDDHLRKHLHIVATN